MNSSTLHKNKIRQYITDNPTFTIQELLNTFECNPGYLNVSMRLLASQGWLVQNIIDDGINIQYKLTKKGDQCFSLAHHYDAFSKFIPILINIDRYLFALNAQSVQNDFDELVKTLELFNSKYNITCIRNPINRIISSFNNFKRYSFFQFLLKFNLNGNKSTFFICFGCN